MISMGSILKALDGHILNQQCQRDTLPSRMLLLEADVPLSPQCTYVGTLEDAMTLPADAPVFLLLSSPNGQLQLPPLEGNILITDLPLATLFNRAYALTDSGWETEQLRSTSAFLCDVLEERVTDEEQLRLRAEALPKPVHRFLSCIAICPCNPPSKQQRAQMLQDLEVIFPDDNFAFYQNNIVVLHTQKERVLEGHTWDADALTDYLHRYDAYAGVSHATRYRNHLRTLWQLSTETAHIGRTVHREGVSDCIFSYQDYGMYYIIDLCANEFIKVHHHDDLIYLVHPAVVVLCRHDETHGTNLRDVLFYYLLSHCSLNKTAQRLYMHRNTVLNKLNKIEEITHLPLNDGYLQIYLIFSCLIMRYCEQYLGKKLDFFANEHNKK